MTTNFIKLKPESFKIAEKLISLVIKFQLNWYNNKELNKRNV